MGSNRQDKEKISDTCLETFAFESAGNNLLRRATLKCVMASDAANVERKEVSDWRPFL